MIMFLSFLLNIRPAKVTTLLVESISTIQGMSSSYALQMQITQHDDPQYGGLL